MTATEAATTPAASAHAAPTRSPAPGAAPPDVRGWSLRRRLGTSFLVLAVLLAAAGAGLVIGTVVRVHTTNVLLHRLQPADEASQRMLLDMINQETGVRGYLLTHQVAALGPYVRYRPQQRVDTNEVLRLAGSYAGVRGDVQRFDAAAARWHRQFVDPVLREAHGGRASGFHDPDAGRPAFNRIRAASARLTSTLDGLISKQNTVRDRENLYFNILLGLLLGLVAAAGIALWVGLHRWVLRPVAMLGGQTRQVAGGELRHEIDPSGPDELVDLGNDVEAMRARLVLELARSERITEDLRRQGEELERSNADLQQFAYVASHDLSEPLRKVANFCQLLERQYGPQLDDRARQYIDFAVDGAKRMQALITDLLALSRVGRATDTFEMIDLDKKLDQALVNLSDRMVAAGATVERLTPLPAVRGDRALLISLLENLIGNAVKYHRDGVPPVVTLRADRDGPMWRITVSDNGIGIDAQYAERIFAVFQRLHLRDQYGGTGIGLALCRRIVEFHGGRIWLQNVDSAPGATFVFTLPLEGGPRAEHLR